MFAVLYTIALFIALLGQTNILLSTVGAGLRVDFALLIVVYFSLFWGSSRPVILGFLTGLFQDALSSEVLGLNALSKTLTAFTVHTLCRNVQIHSVVAQWLFTGLAIVVDMLGRLIVMIIFQLNTFEPRIIVSTLVQQTLISLCLVPLVCRGLQALAKGLRVRQEKLPEGTTV
jgi:rod shape-determining protein MreD